MLSQSVVEYEASSSNTTSSYIAPPPNRRLTYASCTEHFLNSSVSSGSIIDAPSDEDDFHRSQQKQMTESSSSPNPTSPMRVSVPQDKKTNQSNYYHGRIDLKKVKIETFASRDDVVDTRQTEEPRSIQESKIVSDSPTINNEKRKNSQNTMRPLFTNRLVGISTPKRYGVTVVTATPNEHYAVYSHHDTAGTLHTTITRPGGTTTPTNILRESETIGTRDDEKATSREPFATPRRRKVRGSSLMNRLTGIQQHDRNLENSSTTVNSIISPNYSSVQAITINLKAFMCFGIYFLIIAVTTDVVTFSNAIAPWKGKTIQQPPSYSVSHGREVQFPRETTNAKESKPKEDDLVVDNGPNHQSDGLSDADSNEAVIRANRSSPQTIDSQTTLPHSVTKHLRQPQFVHAKTSARKTLPVYRPQEPLLSTIKSIKQQQHDDSQPVEKFVFHDAGPIGALRDESNNGELSFFMMLVLYLRLVVITSVVAVLFVSALKEIRRKWIEYRSQRVRVRSQRSR